MKNIVFLSMLFLIIQPSAAQSIMDVNLLDVRSSQEASMSKYTESIALVVIFTSSKCPYVKYYNDRIKKLVSKYDKQGIKFVLVNPNTSENLEIMKSHSQNFDMPYFQDHSHLLVNALGAKKTPEVFVIHDGLTVYSGSIDDNPQVADQVNIAYLDQAISKFLNDQSTSDKQRPLGCMIK